MEIAGKLIMAGSLRPGDFPEESVGIMVKRKAGSTIIVAGLTRSEAKEWAARLDDDVLIELSPHHCG